MKYLFAAGNNVTEIREHITATPPQSGCYNWINVFEGAVANYQKVKDRLDEFDVVHINMVPGSFASIIDAHNRLKNSSTKLVLNNDYLPEVWEKWNQDPMLYHSIQELGDCVFGTEPIQTSQMIDRAITIPHPTDVKELKRINYQTNKNWMSVIYNVYDKNLYHTTLMQQRLKDEFKFKTKLLNYVTENKIHNYCSKYFDIIKGPLSFREWLMEMGTSEVGYMPHQYHGYNRAGVEYAALGVPVVGSDRSYSLEICYPELVCNPMDFKATKELFKQLQNKDFKEHISEKAKERSEYFNYENSKKRFTEMLDKVKK